METASTVAVSTLCDAALLGRANHSTAKGGPTTLENLALACQGCNNHKYDKVVAPDPVSGEIVPLFHPRRDHWESNFAWSDDFTLIIGLTPTGGATVATLLLNRDGVANLRRLLYAIGEHPPPITDRSHRVED
jgi:hypothetical protein